MNYFQRYLAEEFAEDYQEGRISRRKALKFNCISNRQRGRCQFHPGGLRPSPIRGRDSDGRYTRGVDTRRGCAYQRPDHHTQHRKPGDSRPHFSGNYRGDSVGDRHRCG